MAARLDLEVSGQALAVVVDVEKLRESVPVSDVARLPPRRLRRVLGSGPAARFAAAELRRPGMRGLGSWGNCASGGGGGGGGVEAGEAFAEARGAESGDGCGGVAVTGGAAVRSGLAVLGHGWWWWL